jgi:hypothetical protein
MGDGFLLQARRPNGVVRNGSTKAIPTPALNPAVQEWRLRVDTVDKVGDESGEASIGAF